MKYSDKISQSQSRRPRQKHCKQDFPRLTLCPQFQTVLLACCVLLAEARPQTYAVESYPDEPPVYTFTYGWVTTSCCYCAVISNTPNVRVADDYSQNNYGASETRDGYNTQGEYFVNLPDGRLQKVGV